MRLFLEGIASVAHILGKERVQESWEGQGGSGRGTGRERRETHTETIAKLKNSNQVISFQFLLSVTSPFS